MEMQEREARDRRAYRRHQRLSAMSLTLCAAESISQQNNALAESSDRGVSDVVKR